MTVRDLYNRLARATRGASSAVAEELRSNARARLGVVAVGLVLLVALSLRVADHVASRNARIVELSAKVRELDLLSSAKQASQWKKADVAFARRIAESRTRLWSDLPIGVAHADFYAWVEEAAGKSGLEGVALRLGDVRKIGKSGQITEMRVVLTASGAQGATLDQQSMYAFLKVVTREPRLIVARRLRLRFVDPPLLEAELAAFVPTSGGNPPKSAPAGALVLGGLVDAANDDAARTQTR